MIARRVVVSLLVVAASACSSGTDGQKKERPPTPVTVSNAVTQPVPVEVTAVGSAVAFSTVSVLPRVAGQIVSLDFHEGQPIKKGQPLFDIDPAPYAAALEQAEAVLSRDTVQAETADAEAARYQKLIEQKLVAPSDADAKIVAAKALHASIAADKAAVDTARLSLSWTHVVSPINGVADKRQVDVGNIVQPVATQMPIVVLRTISPIQVQFGLPQDRLIDLQTRMKDGPVEVTASLPDHPDVHEKGTLTFVGASVDAATGTILCKGDFENVDEHLWPGAYVQVKVTIGKRDQAVVVPASSVLTSQQGLYAYVVKSDLTVEMRPVVTGELVGADIEVEKGIAAGEQVVVDGQMSLVPGAKVVLKPAVGTTP